MEFYYNGGILVSIILKRVIIFIIYFIYGDFRFLNLLEIYYYGDFGKYYFGLKGYNIIITSGLRFLQVGNIIEEKRRMWEDFNNY